MTASNPTPQSKNAPNSDAARDARMLIRRGLKCALGTLSRANAGPYVSLVTIATSFEGAPLMLISKLALHTQNLSENASASLLFDGTSATGDPLAGGRVTVTGRAVPAKNSGARRRFLARHPASLMYADFPDFAFYQFEIESAHFIGGFGRIVDLSPAELLLKTGEGLALAAAEADIVAHMNSDHADAISLYATKLADGPQGAWRMTGLDPEGADLVADGVTARLAFSKSVISAEAARLEFIRMATAARTN